MATLSSFSFSLISPNGGIYRDKFQNNRTNCLLCGEILLKRRRRLVAGGDFGRLNSVIRSCYNGDSNQSDDSTSSSSNGERESNDSSNLATMAPAEKESEDSVDDPPASASSRVSQFFKILCFKMAWWYCCNLNS